MKLKKIAYVVIIASLVLFRPDNQGEAHASGQPDPKVRTKPRPALPRYAQGEVLMKMDPSFKGYYKPSSLPEGAREMKKIDNFGLNRIMLKPGVSVEEAVESYKKLPGVAYAEPNYIYRSLAVTPSDTDFGIQWGLHNAGQVITQVYDPHTNTMIDGKGTADADIDATEAWDISTGSGEIIVAILDSGVSWNHPELIENIWQNPGETENGEDSDRNGYIDDVRGWDFIDTDNDPSDFNEHGTHIAGTLGATTNNGKGVAGVSWNVKIMPIRVLDTIGSGLTSSLVAAVNYAIDHGAKIINLSLGGPDMSQAFLDALERAQGAGILIVVACGNGDLDGIGDNNDIYPIYPASYDLDNIVSVAASDYNDNLTVFSNYGAKSVDIAAPGQYIYSTFPARKTVFADDFSTLADWTHGGVKDLWGLTSYLYYSPPSALTDSPNPEPYSEETGLYENSTDSWVRSKTFSLEGEIGCQLSYIFAGSLEPNKDFMQTEISSDGGLNWRPFTEAEGAGIFTGLMPEAVVMVHDLSAFENKPTIAIRFHLITDATGQDRGVLIDDVQVSCHSTTYAGDEYGFLEGTSMAAPFVSGVALLMMSNNPALSASDVKYIMMGSADKKTSLANKVASGGRLNAYASLVTAGSGDNTPPSTTADPAGGVYQSSMSVTLTCDDGAGTGCANIYYTTDKTEPTTHSTRYSSPIPITRGTLLKFFSMDVAANREAVKTESYTIGNSTPDSDIPPEEKGNGCFIATAAYGSYLHPYVNVLREFRDRHLLKSGYGRYFVEQYYHYSPPLADYISESPALRFTARILISPMVFAVLYPFTALAMTSLLLLFAFRFYCARMGAVRNK